MRNIKFIEPTVLRIWFDSQSFSDTLNGNASLPMRGYVQTLLSASLEDTIMLATYCILSSHQVGSPTPKHLVLMRKKKINYRYSVSIRYAVRTVIRTVIITQEHLFVTNANDSPLPLFNFRRKMQQNVHRKCENSSIS